MQDIGNLCPFMEQVKKVAARRHAQKHIDVGKAQVRVQKNDPFARVRDQYRQIDGNIGFTDSSFAGSNGKHDGRP